MTRAPGPRWIGLVATILLTPSLPSCSRDDAAPRCGDGRVSGDEACDDGNSTSGDGCSSRCRLEVPQVESVCGDGVIHPAEACDDGNLEGSDGCSSTCLVLQGWRCSGSPSSCVPLCGDWTVRGAEACDDGNGFDGDGCSSTCAIERGWTCDASSGCSAVCGDGLTVGAETCDDGNLLPLDGCSATCVAQDTWTPILADSVYMKEAHSAVWTGSEMLVFGYSLSEIGTGFRYSPATQVGRPLPVLGAPGTRMLHAAVWTGSEMFIWGGFDFFLNPGFLNSGSIYNPASNTWRPVSMVGAPSPRREGAVVWTGSEILVFGGVGAPQGDGARYDPLRDVWTPMSLSGAPVADWDVRGVWTGHEMVVVNSSGAFAYDPVLDRWQELFMPRRLGYPRWVDWVGGEVIVIGEFASLRYDPVAHVWSPMTPPSADLDSIDAFVSTGSEIFAHGSNQSGSQRYVLAIDRWVPVSPWGRDRNGPSLVWTGSEVLAWGGWSSEAGNEMQIWADGARYDPRSDSWRELESPPQGQSLDEQAAVWTGSELLLFGGDTGFSDTTNDAYAFQPSTHRWRALSSADAPSPRRSQAAVWTGTSMIIWGGATGEHTHLGDGGEYDLATDTWRALPLAGAPSPRAQAFSVWTGREVIIWGGVTSDPRSTRFHHDGARYDPVARAWRPISLENAPVTDWGWPVGVWTGSELILWYNQHVQTHQLPSAYSVEWASYSPTTDTWSRLNPVGAPTGQGYAGVWTGEELIVLGADQNESSGARYDPATGVWTPIALPVPNFPPRVDLGAVWTGREMIVWGGSVESPNGAGSIQRTAPNEGARYDPATDRWSPLPTTHAPAGRSPVSLFWTGEALLVWGGSGLAGGLFHR